MVIRVVHEKQSIWQSQEILDWLMAGDPAIRWQVMRDLLDHDADLYKIEQEKVAKVGWGKEFLAYQDGEGMWGGGIYGPKWISTTYTMLTLRRIGLPAENEQAHKGCWHLLEQGRYQDGGINYFASQTLSEACVSGMVLSILAYFLYPDPYIDGIADHLLRRQMPDGGWNCEDYRGAIHSSFHTTLSVLEGLLEYQKSRDGVRVDIESARVRGHEFLLKHRLYKSHRTGEVVSPRMTRMPYPPRWFYDFLKALDYFQAYFKWHADQEFQYPARESEILARKHEHDERFLDAIQLLKSKQRKNGLWNMNRGPSGRIYFDMEPAGKPGRWNTLRALRVLKWWEGQP
jgi:hypothetical protein